MSHTKLTSIFWTVSAAKCCFKTTNVRTEPTFPVNEALREYPEDKHNPFAEKLV